LIQLITPTIAEKKCFTQLTGSFKAVSEMKVSEQEFLHTLISRYRPKTLVELGVAAGSSTVVMLDAIANIKGAHLYSIDKSDQHYHVPNKKTGFVVADYPKLAKKWTLFTGGFACKFLNKIDKKIDFCLIDTVHANPGEILDTLMILPQMKEGGVLVYHDTNLQTLIRMQQHQQRIFPHSYTNNLLMSALAGEKLVPRVVGKNFLI
jgi:predicted O-methyltransferase YrrM